MLSEHETAFIFSPMKNSPLQLPVNLQNYLIYVAVA